MTDLPEHRPSAEDEPISREPYQWLGLTLITPSLLFISLLFLLPLGMTVWMSLHSWPLLGTPRFIGGENFVELFGDGRFWRSIRFTVLYTVLVTSALFLVAFPLALLVDKPLRIAGLFRTIYFMPVVIGFGAAATLWTWLLNPDNGVFAELLLRAGIVDSAPRPTESFWPALLVVILMVVWKQAGFTMVILLTGLQSVSDDVIEAAKIDGAGPISRFFRVTLPLMRNAIILALVLNVTWSMLAFDQFFVITQGGPRNSTVTAVFSIYLESFSSYRLGYGSAMSMVLLIILVAISATQMAILNFRNTQE
ncbi:carbohydrate ABC transporter permease [Pelagovum pacificum]|uniref:Sugar ABC transporter permease n=1 Tax=Pelagovum pacificum TaxID=2588711 RepID=A0A5C5G9U8_9RHOB|nr:sugar ABC transporter permease [Pelagovum pacificum]QQA41790.1 sugar ABC transporter permease [Pelagovum pacificum]TNY30768.1 sugar ABC transporter permease [Pelagovum pacificum]